MKKNLVLIAFTGFFIFSALIAAYFLRWSKADLQSLSSQAPIGPAFFINTVKELKNVIEIELTVENCPSRISSYTDALYNLPTRYFMPVNEDQTLFLKAEGLHTLQEMFELRLALRRKLKVFESEGSVPLLCVDMIRRAFRVSRFSEEFLLEWLQSHQVIDSKTYLAWQGPFPHIVVNPDYQKEDLKFQVGDVLLIYGKSPISATISQIADEPGSFSHQAIIGQDRKQNLYLIEALIETGTHIIPLKEWLKTADDTRSIHYRYEDPKVGQMAGRLMYDRAQNYIDKNKSTIRYDFAMDDKDHATLFCPEVIQAAYEYAAQSLGKQPLIYPRYRTQVRKLRGTGYLEAMGITPKDLLAPSDIEVDTRFHMLEEYRNLPILRHMRLQEAVLRSVFKWMEEKDYKFNFSAIYTAESYMSKTLRNLGAFKDTIPTYIPINVLQTVLKLKAVVNAIDAQIIPWEDQYFKKYGHSFTFREVMEKVEEVRKQDCELSKRSLSENIYNDNSIKKPYSEFHWFFNSPKGC